MRNSCLIIMPPDEPNGYPQGHVNRVYDFVIVPACRLAGFWPNRLGSASFDDPMGVVKEIVDSDIALCDLSANNTNAHYALAIRHVFGLPVTVAKDLKSVLGFDTKGLGIVEYDESLRIDTVQKAIDTLSEALKSAVENKKERHELLYRLGIGIPQFEPSTESDTNTTATPPEEPNQIKEEEKQIRLPIISPLPDYVGESFTEEQVGKLKAGDVFFHLNYGKGKINFVKKDRLANIQFESGPKLLVLAASNYFRKING